MDIEWLRRARGDLRDIAAYIAQDNPDAADRMTDRIVAATETLSTFYLSLYRPSKAALTARASWSCLARRTSCPTASVPTVSS